MPVKDGIAKQLEKRLIPLGAVQARAMFGGHGIFLDGLMFGLLADDRLYLKVDGETKRRFESAGSFPFTYVGRGKPVEMSYWLLPQSADDNREHLLLWARLGLEAARREAAKKRRKTTNRRQ